MSGRRAGEQFHAEFPLQAADLLGHRRLSDVQQLRRAALDRVRHVCDADAAALMEHALTRTAIENDPDFLTRVAIPNAPAFGYVIQISELLAGLALIGGPLLWLFAWERLSDGVRSAVLLVIAAAAIGGALLTVNLHLANAEAHPWLLPDDPFDEGVGLDSVLTAIQLVIATVALVQLRRLRRAHADDRPPAWRT